MLYYALSKDNRITAVSDDWDQVARAQGGHHSLAKHVLGRSIWDFISGQQTQSFLNAQLFTARQTMAPVFTQYRCDSDDSPRQFHMTVSPLDNGGLCLAHVEVPLVLVSPPPSFRGAILRGQCSQCYGLKINDGWVAAETGHKAYFKPAAMGLCPHCRAMAVQAFSAASNSVAIKSAATKSAAPKPLA